MATSLFGVFCGVFVRVRVLRHRWAMRSVPVSVPRRWVHSESASLRRTYRLRGSIRRKLLQQCVIIIFFLVFLKISFPSLLFDALSLSSELEPGIHSLISDSYLFLGLFDNHLFFSFIFVTHRLLSVLTDNVVII